MKKLSIVEWAAVSEIFGTVVVIVSLGFLAFSVQQNTAAIATANEDFTFDLADRYLVEIINNPELIEIGNKVRRGEVVSEIELLRLDAQHERFLNNWERLFIRSVDGHMEDSVFAGWDEAGRSWLRKNMTVEYWQRFKDVGYRNDFEAHVEAILAERE